MTEGPHVLAVGKEGGGVVKGQHAVVIDEPSSIAATYANQSGLRTFGYVLAVASIFVGSGMIAASRKTADDCSGSTGACRTSADGGLLAGGIMVFGGGLLAGAAVATVRDSVSFAVTPLMATVKF